MKAHDLFGGREYTRHKLNLGKPLKRELEEPENKLEQGSEMSFDPHAPYSSSMDDVPLKLLFPKLKMRRRGSKKTKEMESPPKNVGDSSDSAESKVKEMLAFSLEIAIVEKNKKDEYTKIQLNSKVTEERSDMNSQTLEKNDIKLEVGTHPDYNEEGSSNSLKRRQESMQKIDSIINPISPLKEVLGQKIQKELEDTQMGCCSNTQHGHIPEEYPHKRIKIEKEKCDLKLKEQPIHTSGQAKSMVGKVEAELYKPYGSRNKKYRERATPLASNMKDHTDLELRTSALSGKITPDNLCSITQEQIASCAVSGSRVNKDDEVVHRYVAPSSDVNLERIDENAHRDEFKEDSEKVNAPSEVIDSASGSKVKEEPSEVNKVASLSLDEYSAYIMDNCEIAAGCSEHTCSNSSSEQILGATECKAGTTEATKLVSMDDDKKILPAIVSLNEYIKSKKDQPNGSAKADAGEYIKSREGQSNESAKTNAVHMDCLVQEEKTNHKNLHSKVGDDIMHKPTMVDASPDGGRKINTGCRIAKNYDKLVGSDGGKELRTGKPYGSINKKYRKRATPLVSNFKDHANPELRTSALSCKITPENLCSMAKEQLASCAVSGSSVNKDDELMHRFVAHSSCVNLERIVEKAHRDEFKDDSEKVNAPSEVIVSAFRSEVKEGPSEINKVASLSVGEYSTGIMDNCEIAAGCSEHTCSNSSLEQILGVTECKAGTAEATKLVSIDDDKRILPAIISLNEYIKSKKDQPNGSAKADAGHHNKSSEGQSNESAKNNAVHMECLVQEEKTDHKNLHLKVGDDITHKPSMVDACPDGGIKINTGCRIAENYNNLVGSDGGKELRIGKPIKISPDEKLWEGCLQLNAYITVMALAFFKSGAKFQANNWSKFVEVKGRVRLDAFEKFLQELPLSRNRALMVISIRWKVGSSDAGFSGMQEIANSYKQGERVGFAELAAGVDLYVCPPDATMIHMLAKYGFIKNIENVNKKPDDLIGCVVWRRNYTTSNVPLKTPEQYINAKKLALAGLLLASPSHPGVSQWASYGNDVHKIREPACLEVISTSGNVNTERSDKDESRIQTTQSVNQIDAFVVNAKAETEHNTEKDAISRLSNVHGWISHNSDTGDLSPGFSPQLTSSVPHNSLLSTPTASVQTTLPMAVTNSNLTEKGPGQFGSDASTITVKDVQNRVTDEAEDDDDLPEFDFRVVSGASQMQVTHLLPPCSNVQSLPLHQFPAQPSITAFSQCPLPPPVSLTSSACQFNGHKNTPQVSWPPTNPHPSVQIIDSIQKFGHTEAMAHLPPVENCTLKVPVPKISVALGPQSAVSNLPHISPNSQSPYRPSNEVRKSLWDDDDDDMPEWCPPYLEQQDCPRPSVTPVAQSPSTMPKQPCLQPQLGMQNFGGNMHKVHPPPLQGPPSSQLPAPLRGPPPQAPNLPQGPHPPLPQGPRPLRDIVLPIPRPVMNTDTSNSFHPQSIIRPPYCKPDFTPLRPVDGSGRRF